MCVIVTAPAGAMPTTTQLALMSEANPDGAGIAWHDGQRLRRYRNADNHKTLGFIIANHQALAAMPFLLHFRLATHGKITDENTHPFAYRKNGRTGYIAHNKTAHHDRFWNCIDPKMTPIKPKLYPNDATWWGNQWEPFRRPESKGPAGFLTMEHYLLNQLGITYWRNNFVGLMNRYPSIPLKHMGFPENWQSLPIWQ